MANINFTIGCDPEIFVREKKTGRLISGAGLIPGDKREPHKVKYGAVQVDGMALEFNTDPVSIDDGFSAFDKNVVTVLGSLRGMVPRDYEFVYDGSVTFDKEYYDKEVPPEAKELGCDPDFNAYRGGEKNPAPSGDTPRRGAAGHIHIGWGENIPFDHPDHIAICCDFVKCLDAYVGLATLLYESDSALARKDLYGKAGAFRPKSYGVEYRTPSNEWLQSNDRRLLIWKCVEAAIKDMQQGEGSVRKRLVTSLDVDIEAMINNPKGCKLSKKAIATGYGQTAKRFAAFLLWNFSIKSGCVSTELSKEY